MSDTLDLLTVTVRRNDLHLALSCLEFRMGKISSQNSLAWRRLNHAHSNLAAAMLRAEQANQEEELRQ